MEARRYRRGRAPPKCAAGATATSRWSAIVRPALAITAHATTCHGWGEEQLRSVRPGRGTKPYVCRLVQTA
jgi:hypothetical protein